MALKKRRSVWNKGLTKEMDSRVASYGQKVSQAKKGKPTWLTGLPKELRPNYGKHESEKTKQKISSAQKGRGWEWRYSIEKALELKAIQSKRNKGKHFSPSTEFKRGNGKGIHRPLEIGRKISAAKMGHSVSEEQIRKFKERMAGRSAWNKGLEELIISQKKQRKR